MSLYTASRLRVFRECPRKHRFRYELGIQTPSTPAMAFGTHAHKALERWYRAWMLGVDDMRLPHALEYVDSVEDISDVDRARLRVLVVAYHTRWSNEDWEVLEVEVEFRYFLGDVEIGGKIDALIRDRATGRVYVVEHKTSTADTSPGSLYWDRLAIDTQVSIYVDGASFGLDYEISGCIYDVLKRPQHEPRFATPEESRKYTLGKGCKKCGGSAGGKQGIVRGKGTITITFVTTETVECDECDGTGWKKDADGHPQEPRLHSNQRADDETLDEFEERLTNEVADRIDDFLARSVVVRLDDELPRMRQDLLDTIAAMQALEAAEVAPPNHDACVRGREACPFFAACAGRASIDDEHLFPRGVAHPELAAESATSQEAA